MRSRPSRRAGTVGLFHDSATSSYITEILSGSASVHRNVPIPPAVSCTLGPSPKKHQQHPDPQPIAMFRPGPNAQLEPGKQFGGFFHGIKHVPPTVKCSTIAIMREEGFCY